MRYQVWIHTNIISLPIESAKSSAINNQKWTSVKIVLCNKTNSNLHLQHDQGLLARTYICINAESLTLDNTKLPSSIPLLVGKSEITPAVILDLPHPCTVSDTSDSTSVTSADPLPWSCWQLPLGLRSHPFPFPSLHRSRFLHSDIKFGLKIFFLWRVKLHDDIFKKLWRHTFMFSDTAVFNRKV